MKPIALPEYDVRFDHALTLDEVSLPGKSYAAQPDCILLDNLSNIRRIFAKLVEANRERV